MIFLEQGQEAKGGSTYQQITVGSWKLHQCSGREEDKIRKLPRQQTDKVIKQGCQVKNREYVYNTHSEKLNSEIEIHKLSIN